MFHADGGSDSKWHRTDYGIDIRFNGRVYRHIGVSVERAQGITKIVAHYSRVKSCGGCIALPEVPDKGIIPGLYRFGR
jgi:hypothetical protein